MKEESLPSNVSRFLERVDSVVATISDHGGKVRIVSHYDGDGICAAALMTMALAEIGKSFHTTMIKGLNKEEVRRIASEENSLVVFLDLGSGQIDLLEQLEAEILICDHHEPIRTSKKIVQLNPHLFEIDGTYEACGSTLAFLVAERMVRDPDAIFGIALAGILADRQHLGGFSGLNKMLLEKYVEKGAVDVEPSIQLYGPTVLEAVKGSVEPFFRGLSGNVEGAKRFLERLDIEPDSKLEHLHQERFTALSSMLVLRLLRQGVLSSTCEDFIIEKFWLPPFDLYARELSAVVNACGRRDEEHIGLEICLGSKEALERGRKLRKEHRGAIRKDLLRLEEEGAKDMENIQYFYCEDPARAGALAGLSMNYLLDQRRPTFSLSAQKREFKVSSRGTRWLIDRGLNLAEACRNAAREAGGHGGGHPIASGATIPLKGEDLFLGKVDSIVGDQLTE